MTMCSIELLEGKLYVIIEIEFRLNTSHQRIEIAKNQTC